ncbi:MAG: 5'-methylthioadenosine/adenosylhomocysteine nucleosidase [Bacilli bacterium]|jgi:adenosylhomocysteine nucleosidase|nr:5'-methylthioadenosine/adenosylhomocysteine nucleosidase [Bacilli bacterium]
MILIVAAMEEEYQELEKLIDNGIELCCKGIKYVKGFIDNKDVILMLSGVGKVNAAYTITTFIDNFDIDFVINIGSAGGVISKKYDVKVLDIVIAQNVVQHDVDLVLANRLPGVLPNLPQYYPSSLNNEMIKVLKKTNLRFHLGTIASGDQFVGSLTRINEIKNNFVDVCAVEMEAGAIAQVCYLTNTKYLVFRSISDVINGEVDNQTQFEEYIKQASINSARATYEIIKCL